MNDAATEKKVAWEYALTTDLLLPAISSVKAKYSELALVRMQATENLSPQECMAFFSEKMNALEGWIDYTKNIYNHDLNSSWGADGVEGVKEEIEAACKKLINALSSLYDWEVSIAMIVPDASWQEVFKKLQFSTLSFIEDTELFFNEFNEVLLSPDIKGKKTLTYEFKFPAQLKGIEKDVRDAREDSLPESQNDSNLDDVWVGLLKKFIGI